MVEKKNLGKRKDSTFVFKNDKWLKIKQAFALNHFFFCCVSLLFSWCCCYSFCRCREKLDAAIAFTCATVVRRAICLLCCWGLSLRRLARRCVYYLFLDFFALEDSAGTAFCSFPVEVRWESVAEPERTHASWKYQFA